MSSFNRVRQQTNNLLFLHGSATLIATLASTLAGHYLFDLSLLLAFIIGTALGMVANLISTAIFERTIAHPLLYLAQSIEHIVSAQPLSEKKINPGRYGHDLVKHVVDTVGDFMAKVEQSSDHTHVQAQIATQSLNNLLQPVFTLDNQQRIIFVNQAAANLLDSDPETLAGSYIYEVAPLTINGGGFLQQWVTAAQQRVINEEQSWEDVHYVSKNHVTYNFDVHLSFVRNQNDGLESVLMLVDRTGERAYDDLKVDFAAMAAHELRAPITVIRGYVDVFEDEVMPKLDEEQQMFMQKLKVSASQLSGFINNVLNVARIDKGALQITVERCSWPQLITEAIADLQLRAQAHGKNIELQVDDNLPDVAVDPISITEVINNLVDNAIKYSKEGDTIKVNVKLLENGMVETTVVDTGVGIPTNLMDKLFTKFYRSHRTRRDFTGSGLGLFLSKAIIDAHNGDIWAKSKEGQGSTFGFDLQPYDSIQEGPGNTQTLSVNRGKHGWIKNHSLYRQ